MVLLPSEKARLVLGYLGEQGCLQAYKEFLLTSPHLRELRGMIRCGVQPHEYEWKMSGLSDILDEYSSIERLVSPLKINSNNFKCLQDCSTILKKIGLLIELARNFADNSNSDPNRETSSVQVESSIEEQQLKPETQLSKLNKGRNKRICSEFVNNDKIESAIITQNGLPIINDIPESVYSDEGTDICVNGISPPKSKSDEIVTNINTTQEAVICTDTQDQNLAPLDHTKTKNNSEIISIKLDEGLDVSVVKEALLERTDIHEKIAENINKMLSASQKESSRKDDANGDSKVISSCSKINNPDLIDLDDHLNNIIRDIVNITEKDHIFDEFLGELVCKVTNDRSNSSSNEPTSSPGRPTTSTPERSCKNDRDRLDISTSPVEKHENLISDVTNKPEVSVNEGSIKHRLRNRTKTSIEQNKDFNHETNTDITPRKTQNIDLLAMAINNVDVSGSIRKLNSVNNSITKNDNKLVILSNEVVSRNIADYTCLTSMNIVPDDKIENTYQSVNTESHVPLNTHFILPSISTSAVNSNIFTNASLPQYLFGNTDADQARFYLIGGSTLSVPSQNNVVNNDPSNIMAMPTFIMLPPSTAGVPLNENLDLGYQQTIVPSKPKAVTLPETKRGPRKIAPNIKYDPNIIAISEMIIQSNSTNMPSIDGSITNTIKKDYQQKDKELVDIVQNNILKTDRNVKIFESNKASSNSRSAELIRDLSSMKIITQKEDDTPDLSSTQIQKRQSLSTPRRRKSHVRVLDFNTPPKKNIEGKAKTSPKLCNMRPMPKTTEKVSKPPPKSASTKEPVRSILCRSSKSKMIQEEDVDKPNSQDAKKSSVVSHSPLPKLKGDWDQVQGIALIVGDYKQNETDIISLVDTNGDLAIKKNKLKVLNPSAPSEKLAPLERPELANAAPQVENKGSITIENENAPGIFKRISNNDNIAKKTPPKIRILPKRGEKYDFQPTTSKRGKNKQDMVSASKTRWDSELRALAICEKTAVHKRNIRQKRTSKKNSEKVSKDMNKDGSFNTSAENMEIIAKKLEDALNGTLFQHSSDKSTIENMNPEIISEKRGFNEEDTAFIRRSPEIINVAPSNDKTESSEVNIKKANGFEKKQVESVHIECSSDLKLKPKENFHAKSDLPELPILDQNNAANILKPSEHISGNINIKNEVKQQEANNSIISAKISVVPPVNMENCADMEIREISITDNKKDKTLFSDDKNIITGHNFSDTLLVLETPFKCDGNMVPKTPRFILPNVVEDTPLVKIKRIVESSSLAKCGIPTPSFPVTPKLVLASTPEIKTTENEKESTNNSGSTYYKPDVSKNVNCLLQEDSERKTNGIKQMTLTQIKDIEKNQCEQIVNKSGQCGNITQIENNVSDNDNLCNSSISSCNSSSSDDSSTSTSSSSSNDSSIMEKDLPDGLLTTENENENVQQDERTTIKEIHENKSTIDFSKMRREIIVEKSLVTVGQRNSINTNKLAQELSEKRERILTKVRADLQINSMKNFSKNTRNKNITQSKNTKTIVKKNCPKSSLVVSRKSTSKKPSKLNSPRKKCSSIQGRPQKNVTKIPKLTEETLENNSSETRDKVDSDYLNTFIKLDNKLSNNQYPLLHISEDESEKYFGTDMALDDILKKSILVENANIENPCSAQTSCVVSSQLRETNNEILQNVKEDQKNDATLQSKFAVKEPTSSIDNDGNNDVKKCNDEDLYELIIQEQNHIENCFEEQNACTRKLPNTNNDGFDVNSFQIHVPDQGILKISPPISLLEIFPKQKQKIKKNREKIDSAKDFSNKIKTRKSPLNILFDEIDDPVHEVEMNKFLTKTPCSDLYNDSPSSKYSSNKKDSDIPPIKKRIMKAEKSGKKPSIHQNKADTQKAVNRLGEENFGKVSTNSSKTGKRKRDNDRKNLFSKKSRSCNPQEILKTVGVDTFLNALHGPE